MDLKEQIIQEYLQQGCGYRKLQAKYGIGRTTIGITCSLSVVAQRHPATSGFPAFIL